MPRSSPAAWKYLEGFEKGIHTIVTDNDGTFTDCFAVFKKTNPKANPPARIRSIYSAKHMGIEHRLIAHIIRNPMAW